MLPPVVLGAKLTFHSASGGDQTHEFATLGDIHIVDTQGCDHPLLHSGSGIRVGNQLVQLIQGQELAESCRPGRGNSPKHVIELVEVGVLYRNHDRHFLRGSNALDSTPIIAAGRQRRRGHSQQQHCTHYRCGFHRSNRAIGKETSVVWKGTQA